MQKKDMKGANSSTDFIQWLGLDMSLGVLECLDEPSDLLRISAVSRSWRQFIIANGLCKQLCLKMFSELSSLSDAIESDNMLEPLRVKPGDCIEWERLRRDHRVYGFLSRGLSPTIRSNCISEAICASSTDNYPEESIHNTLEASQNRASYWSSEGDSDPSAPEILLYKLAANLSVITEIYIKPFQAYFQYGLPVYSSKTVVFRIGHKVPAEQDGNRTERSSGNHRDAEDKFIWTYTSPEFPMTQENCLQKFELPEPVLCIGDILQVELLGRVQKQDMDELYYICISYIQVVGRPLTPSFDIKVLDPVGKWTLKYNPESECASSPTSLSPSSSTYNSVTAGLMQMQDWQQMIMRNQMIMHAIQAAGFENDEPDDEFYPNF